jgi:hypothetical protein
VRLERTFIFGGCGIIARQKPEMQREVWVSRNAWAIMNKQTRRIFRGFRQLSILGVILTMQSCKQSYSGDGKFSCHQSPLFGLLWPPLIEVKMPEVDISKKVLKTYSLAGLPISEETSHYAIFIVIPSARPGDIARNDWGSCRLEIKKNGKTVKSIHTKFDSMRNNRGGGNGLFLNRLFVDTEDTTENMRFAVIEAEDHFELVFESSGFDAPEPVWAYILIRCGGK